MAMAAFRLLRRNTCWKMHPTISQFNKTSLSPSLPPPSFLCSFPLVPSLWCSPPLRFEYQSTTILKYKYQGDPFREHMNKLFDNTGTKHVRDPESDPNVRDKKRVKVHPNEESGVVSAVNVGLDLEITGDGEDVLKMIKRTITSEGTTTEVERSMQMAKNTAMIKVLLQDMEGKLLAQSRSYLIRSITVRKSD